jgi:hypothetical protein
MTSLVLLPPLLTFKYSQLMEHGQSQLVQNHFMLLLLVAAAVAAADANLQVELPHSVAAVAAVGLIQNEYLMSISLVLQKRLQ